MTTNLEQAVSILVETLSFQNTIRAVGLSGGNENFPNPGEGDLDLFIYCTRIPSGARRKLVLEALGADASQIKIKSTGGLHWGQGDSLLLAGVETWLMYFTIDETLVELKAILDGQYLDRIDNDFYPVGRCAMFQKMSPLFDPDGVITSFQSMVAEYPLSLAQAITAYHLERLEDREDLERAVFRRDVLFYHFALDRALDHFLQVLFALNRTYFPSRKRSFENMVTFQNKPINCEQRLLKLVKQGGSQESLTSSQQGLNALVEELRACTYKGFD